MGHSPRLPLSLRPGSFALGALLLTALFIPATARGLVLADSAGAASPPAGAPAGAAVPSRSGQAALSGRPSPSTQPAPAQAAQSAAKGADPWGLLQEVRRKLVEGGPAAASFTQTYIPAGFSSGEKEGGQLSLALPDCLRWDYQEPYPKGFLLCGEMVHAWNPVDKTGRRYPVDRRNEPGLDLLLLGTTDLKARYNATLRPGDNGRTDVVLGPRSQREGRESPGEVVDAVLSIDPQSLRLVALSYHDREGNLTRFEIGDYKAVPRQGQFSPPSGIRWEEQ